MAFLCYDRVALLSAFSGDVGRGYGNLFVEVHV